MILLSFSKNSSKSQQSLEEVINSFEFISEAKFPWAEHATSIVKTFMQSNGEVAAQSIQRITHPSGDNPSLKKINVIQDKETIQVEISVDWQGGIIGGWYVTTVVWTINAGGHISAIVTGDSAAVQIKAKNKQELNDYFKNKFYPFLKEALK